MVVVYLSILGMIEVVPWVPSIISFMYSAIIKSGPIMEDEISFDTFFGFLCQNSSHKYLVSLFYIIYFVFNLFFGIFCTTVAGPFVLVSVSVLS